MSFMATVSDLSGQICALDSNIKGLSEDHSKKTKQLQRVDEAIKQMEIAENKLRAIIDQLEGMQISGRWKGKRASDFRQSAKGKGAVWRDAVAVYEAVIERLKTLNGHKRNLENEIGGIRTNINTQAKELDRIKKQQLLLNSAK